MVRPRSLGRPLAALAGCCLLAAVLGGWNLGFGLPFLFRPDEDVMVGRAVRMAVEHSLDPLFYVYPPVAFYLFAAAEGVLGLVPGHHLGPATAVDPTLVYLVARTVSLLATVLAVGLTWVVGRHAYGPAAGTLAAAALAVAPLTARQAHFATTDAPQLGMLAVALWAGQRASSRRGYALAGAACAVAAATKYTAGAVVVYVAVMALWRRPLRPALANLAAAAGAFLLAFAILLAVSGHARAFLEGALFLGGRAGSYSAMPPGWLYHSTRSLPFGLGLGTFVLALAGIAVAAWRRSRLDLALLAYLAAGFLPIAVSHEVFFRYALPLLPGLCLLAGGGLRALPARLGGPALAAAALLLLPSGWNSLQADRLLGATDTRAEAAAWLDANAPPGSTLVVDSYWTQPYYGASELGHNPLHPLYASGDPVADSFQQGRFTRRFHVTAAPVSAGTCYRLVTSEAPWQTPPAAPAGATPAAVFAPGRPGGGAVYDRLDSFFLPVWGFDGIERPGPVVLIFPGCG